MEATLVRLKSGGPFGRAIRDGVANLFRPEKNSPMEKDYLALKRTSASRPSGQWNDDDYDVLADGVVVGRLFKMNAAPVGMPWMWTLEVEHCGDRRPT